MINTRIRLFVDRRRADERRYASFIERIKQLTDVTLIDRESPGPLCKLIFHARFKLSRWIATIRYIWVALTSPRAILPPVSAFADEERERPALFPASAKRKLDTRVPSFINRIVSAPTSYFCGRSSRGTAHLSTKFREVVCIDVDLRENYKIVKFINFRHTGDYIPIYREN